MRGHWAYRSVAGFMIGFFLILTVGIGEASHVCPVHDPVLAEVMATGSAHHGGGHAGLAAMGAMGAHQQMGAGSSHGDQHPGHDRTHCCCTGFACITTAVTLPSERLELPDVAISSSSTPELPEYARSVAVPAYFIPFANGPPTLSERSA
ncbi:MAG TPA: hypothetical protein VIP79_01000 [Gemmatimonadaceae bacterium]